MLRLQVGDDRAGDVVVRREDALDVVVRLDQHLVEDGRRIVRIPVGHELLRAPLDRVGCEERVEDGEVAGLEPERVLVGLAAPELGDPPPVYVPFAFIPASTPLAWAAPTALPSKVTYTDAVPPVTWRS